MNGTPFAWDFPYASARMPVLARNIVATSQPLAAQAGLQMLAQGGNAVDAAIAAAITLTVVEPTSNGIGSDAFAILWDGQQLHGLNASGRSPAAWTPELFSSMAAMPQKGWGSVTVPGAVSAWAALSERFGRLPFEKLFAPAIGYARHGYLVSPITARAWQSAAAAYQEFPEFGETFLINGAAPAAGTLFRCEAQAQTLEEIASTRGESFYRGRLAEQIASHAARTGGWITTEDLATHAADWVGTVAADHRGVTIHEIPPNGQGLAALIALGILETFDLTSRPVDSADSLHLQIEAMKLALADAYRYVSDPDHLEFPCEDLLDPGYLQERARLIDPRRAGDPGHGAPGRGGTVYLTAADAEGRMVSYIQSNYFGFGSGIVVPGTGIALQNRGHGFTLQEGHPNRVAGRKRPFHTIIPAFATRDGQPVMSFGVMGGPMQAQGHVQIAVRVFDYLQNPQAADDAPRWQVLRGREVAVEAGFAPAVLEDLRSRGHEIRIAHPSAFGGCQAIYRLNNGYCASSDPRKDGQAVGF